MTGGPHVLSAAVVVTTSGMPNVVAARASAATLCFSSPSGMSRTPDSRPTWWSTSTTATFSRVIGSRNLLRSLMFRSFRGLSHSFGSQV